MGRWFLIFGIITVIAFFIFVAWAIPAQGVEYETAIIKVHYGDTLTGYAREYAPNMAVRDYIDEVKRMNHLGGTIYAGDELVILKEVK